MRSFKNHKKTDQYLRYFTEFQYGIDIRRFQKCNIDPALGFVCSRVVFVLDHGS